ncbi:MAG: hypothetical protein R2813_05030 [Flavobacteriales bacterium]
MRLKQSIFLVLAGLVAQPIFGQNESDALQFSRGDILGTARYTGMGGAFTALGGDPSATSINPAGVAVYRNNEFSLTPAYHENFSAGSYYGSSTNSGKSNFNIASFSIVGVQPLRQAGKWRNTAISFGMNRVATYHQKYSVEGSGIATSILDDYVRAANSYNIDSSQLAATFPFDLYPLWANYLINNVPGQGSLYYKNVSSWPLDQSYSVASSGAKRQTYFNAGGNYDDKLYLGVGVNMSTTRLDRTSTFSEFYDQNDTSHFIDEFSHTYYEDFYGVGWSANLGMIYRPVDALRLGLSWKTPEVMNLEYSLKSDNVTVEEGIAYEVASQYYINEYKYRTISPMQTTVGMAYIFKKYGLISLEADYVDYRTMAMMGRSDSDPFTAENASIKRLLNPVINMRGGFEYRITSFLSARAGYAYYGNPYKKAVVSNGTSQIYSLGLGYRTEDFSFDCSYQYKFSSDKFFLYDPALVESAQVDITDHRIAVTFGVKL